MRRPNIHRLGAGKNARAPADALEETPAVGSAAVLGRINPTTDPTTCFDHANSAPECSPAGMRELCVCPHICSEGLASEISGLTLLPVMEGWLKFRVCLLMMMSWQR